VAFGSITGFTLFGGLPEAQSLPGIEADGAGGVQLSIPLAIPPSPVGIAPSLSIQYTGSDESLIPGGFDIDGLEMIMRDASAGVLYTGTDRYVSSLGGRMVLVSGGTYRNKNDQNIEYQPIGSCGDGPCSWRATLPDGKVLTFGETTDGQLYGPDETDRRGVSQWGISRVEDLNGNAYRVTYLNENGTLYPETIEYTLNPTASFAANRITFAYADRVKSSVSYGGGVKSVLSKKLQSITVQSDGAEVYRYEFEYALDNESDTAQERLVLYHEYIKGSEVRLPLSFSYTGNELVYTQRDTGPTGLGLGIPDMTQCTDGATACGMVESSLQKNEVPPLPVGVLCGLYVSSGAEARCKHGSNRSFGDINGDGKMDFVRAIPHYSGGLITVYEGANQQKITFLDENGSHESDLQTGQSYGLAGSQSYLDVNGDGRGDFVRMGLHGGTDGNAYEYLVSISDGNGYGIPEFWLLPAAMKIRSMADVGGVSQWGDVDGDGKNDLIRFVAPGRIGVAFSTGSGFRTTGVYSNVDQGVGGAAGLQTFVDFNGDGRVDYCRLTNSGGVWRLKVSLGRDDGTFVESYTSDLIAEPGHPKYRRMTDVNGDGLADFVRVGTDLRTIYVSLSTGYGLAPTTSTNTGESIDQSIATQNGGMCALGQSACDIYAFAPTYAPAMTLCLSYHGSGLDRECEQGKAWGIADMNGDGKSDYIHYRHTGNSYEARVTFYHDGNFKGGTYTIPSAPISIENIVTGTVAIGDVNGDGIGDLVFPGHGTVNISSLAPTNRHALASVMDGDGKSVAFTYMPQLNTAGAVNPDRNATINGFNGNYSLLANPSPQFLLSRVKVSGRSGPYVKTEYTYENGRLKIGPTRDDTKPLGFERVVTKQFIAENGNWIAAPTYTKLTNYHYHPALGYDGAGLPASTETIENTTGSILARSVTQFVRPAAYPYPGLIRIVPAGETSENFATTPSITTRSTVTDFDANGNPLRSVSEGDLAIPGDDTVTTATYEYPANVPAGRIATTTTTGAKRSYRAITYDGSGNPVQIDAGLTPATTVATTMSYNGAGQPLTQTRNGLTMTTAYDAAGFVTAVTKPGSGTSLRTTDGTTGQPVSETDPAGYTTRYEYDALGRMTRMSRGNGVLGMLYETLRDVTVTKQNDGTKRIETQSAFDGSVTQNETAFFDEWGRQTRSERSGGAGSVVSETTYNRYGQQVEQSLPHYSGTTAPGVKRTVYDSLGRAVSVTQPGPNGPVTITTNPTHLAVAEFTGSGGVTLRGYAIKQTAINGQESYAYKTADGRTIQSEYQNGSGWTRVRYHYDPTGQLVARTIGHGASRTAIADDPALTVRYEYNQYGEKVREIDPDAGTTVYTYTVDHRLACVTTGDGRTVCRDYDAQGRVVALREGTKLLATYRYDEARSTAGTGRLTSIVDESGERLYHYDGINGKTKRIERSYDISGKGNPFAPGTWKKTVRFDTDFTWSPAGVLLSKRYNATGIAYTYDYYADGNLHSIVLEDPNGNVVTNGTVATLVSYGIPDANGNLADATYGNGVRIDTAYDPASGVLRNIKANGAAPLVNIGYSYTNDGMIAVANDALKSGGLDLTASYKYDIAHRLIEATGPYGTATQPTVTQQYIYGPDGQPLTMAGTTLNYADAHKVRTNGAVSYTWDTDTAPGRGRVVVRENTVATNVMIPGYRDHDDHDECHEEDDDHHAHHEYDDCNRMQTRIERQELSYNTMDRLERVDGWRNILQAQNTTASSRQSDHRNQQNAHDHRQSDGHDNSGNGQTGTWNSLYGRPDYTVNFQYDANGNRFSKTYTENGNIITTHYPAPDYQIRTSTGTEIHTLVVWNGNGLLATFSFPALYHLAGGISPSQYGGQIAHLFDQIGISGFGGIGHFPDLIAMSIGYAKAYQNWDRVLYTTLSLVSLVALIMIGVFLYRSWRRYDIHGNEATAGINGLSLRLTASLVMVSLYAMTVVSCSNHPGDGYAFGHFKKRDLVGLTGGHFYLTDPVGSVSYVTDVNGIAVTRYVYKPYGKLNAELTNLDLDGDRKLYESIYKYNGQEYDYEIGLYNYKARMYDQSMGRFLSTDPVLTERIGYDSYDPYNYVYGNPVNFTDPTGGITSFNKMVSAGIRNLLRSGNWKNIPKAYSNFIYGKDHNCKSVSMCGIRHAGPGLGKGLAAPIALAAGIGVGAAALGAGSLGMSFGIPYGLLSNSQEFIRRPIHAIGSYLLAGFDVGISTVLNPLLSRKGPIVKHYPGGAVISNSFIADNIENNSFSIGGAAFLESGAPRQVMLHERGHNRTSIFKNWDLFGSYSINDWDADTKAYTMNYDATKFLFGLMMYKNNPGMYEQMLLYNLAINPDQKYRFFVMEFMLQYSNRSYVPIYDIIP